MLREIESILNESPSENLASLFCETLGWSQPTIRAFSLGIGSPVKRDISFVPIAQLSGLQVFRLDWHENKLPNVTQRRAVYQSLAQSYAEHLICYVTNDGKQIAFVWARKSNGRNIELRTLPYEVGGLARTTIERINEMSFSLEELDLYGDQLTITEVRRKLDKAFDVEAVTERFFSAYCEAFRYAEGHISGIDSERKRLFTQKLFNRLLFIRFLEKKGWLSFNGRTDYLNSLWEDYRAKKDSSNFYKERLSILFFSGLNAPNNVNVMEINRGGILKSLIGDIPYLNGGLFEKDEDDSNSSIVVPDEAIKNVLTDIFYRFNFTITETTPLDIEVAVDPEMLGKIFERLVTGRQDSGAYYTPKSIVSFMCREALKGYLGNYDELIDNHNADNIRVAEARDLLGKLTDVKVCDPACGSGAYLLGMLQELNELMRLLDTRTHGEDARNDYQRKLNIIQDNIYGVDLDQFAVNIARLRLWLSLTVEYEGDKPEPLPNLDFKVEQGDSLLAPDPYIAEQGIRDEFVRQFHHKKSEYMNEHHYGKKQTILEDVNKLRQQVKKWTHPKVTIEGFDWAVEFAEVFINGGFDIVIANPPYGLKCEDPLRFQYFPRIQGEDPQSKDSYGLFMARGLQLLKPKGFFTFIVSDTWRTISSHHQLRKKLLEETTVFHVLDLPSWVFDATVNTCILSLCKAGASVNHELVAGDLRNLPNNDWRALEANLSAVAGRVPDAQTITYARYTYAQSLISTYDNLSFFIGSPRLYSLMSDKKFVKVGDIADAKVGLQTGDNEYYLRKRAGSRGSYQILDESKLLTEQELTNLTEDEKRNGVNPTKYEGRHFVPYDKGGESDANKGWLPNYYVPTQYFIDWSEESVYRLKTYSEDPRTLRSIAVIRNPDYYFRQGLTFSDTGVYSPSFRQSAGSVFDQKGSIIVLKDSKMRYFLLGLLCSTLARYVYKVFVNHTVSSHVDSIKEFPCKLESEFITTLERIILSIIDKQKTDSLYPYHRYEQREADLLIYQFYNLIEDDIREIELWYCRRYSKLAESQGLLVELNEKYADHIDRCEHILSKPSEYWKSHPMLGLIAQGEGQNQEFKETLEFDIEKSISNKDLIKSALKTVAGFMNADGGILFIGVSDLGEVKGISRDLQFCNNKNNDGLQQKIRDLLANRFKPMPINKVQISFEQLPDDTICQIKVEALPNPDVAHLDNEVYIRDGNVTRKLEGIELTNWIKKRNS